MSQLSGVMQTSTASRGADAKNGDVERLEQGYSVDGGTDEENGGIKLSPVWGFASRSSSAVSNLVEEKVTRF
jgi:hypothetical protein